ncbi:MAG: FliM/FliN family flagellar motor C-terminal domain-containing protein [Acidimicrobiales bacterium]
MEPDTTRDIFGSGSAGSFDDAALGAVNYAVAELLAALSGTWSELLGREIEVTTTAITNGPEPLIDDPTIEQAPLLAGIGGDEPFVAVADLGTELGAVAIVVPTLLGLSVVDVLLGGSGRPSGDRTLSVIDAELLHTVVPPTLAVLGRLGDPERSAPQPVALTELEEIELSDHLASGVVIELAVSLGDPAPPLFVVVGSTGARLLTGTSGAAVALADADVSRQVMTSVLADVVVEAVVTFPPVQVPSHTVLALGVGDVVKLGYGTDQPLPLHVDGHHLADVRPARAGTEVACQVVATTLASQSKSVSASGGLL